MAKQERRELAQSLLPVAGEMVTSRLEDAKPERSEAAKMALNRIEDRQLWHHDKDGDTLEVAVIAPSVLRFENSSEGFTTLAVFVERDAVETLRDCLSRWLETGKFTSPDANREE